MVHWNGWGRDRKRKRMTGSMSGELGRNFVRYTTQKLEQLRLYKPSGCVARCRSCEL
jgi:hypothetical protein